MIYLAGTDFSHLTNDELVNGIKALNIPDYIRTKSYGIDVRETLAQMTEMLMQLAYNQGMNPQQAQNWVSQLNNKIVKGQVTMSDLTQEVKEALTGGAVAVVGVGAVGTSNIVNGAVTSGKTDFLLEQKNLINPYKVSNGQVNRLTGSILSNELFEHTDYIDVSNLTNLVFSPLPTELARVSFAFYDENLDFISGDNMEGKVYISKPQGASKMRISWRVDDVTSKDSVQLESGTLATDYEPYAMEISQLKLDGDQISNNTISASKLEFAKFLENQPEKDYEVISLNSYNNPLNDGKILNSSGELVQTQYTSDYTVTNSIPVKGDTLYYAKFRNALIYNGGTPIKFIDNTGNDFININTPNVATHIRLSVDIDLVSDLSIIRRTPLDDERIFEIPNLMTSSYSRFSDKTIASFGDSITGNNPTIVNTIQSRLGNTSLNFGIGGAKMAERNDVEQTAGGGHTANSGIRIAESIVSGDFSAQRTYTNAMYTGATLDRILSTIDLLESTDFNTIDYATVQFGANDYLQGVPIGTIDSDRYTFMGAYRIFLETIMGAYPNIKLLLVSTPINYNAAPKEMTIADYVQATKEVADYFNLPFLDNYTNAGINKANRLSFFNSNDGVHPNDTGLTHLGNRIASAIGTNY